MFKFTEEVKKLLHLGSETAGKVFVLDGADPVGHRVVERLIDSGYTDLRVGVRTTKQISTSGTTEFVPFMWEDETTYDTALDGVKTVFMTLPIKPDDWDTHFPHFLKSCTKHHVKKVVKLSFFHSIKPKGEHPSKAYGDPAYIDEHTGFHDVPLVHKHALCDGDLILHKELDETILFATHLMSNIFRYNFDRKGLAEAHEFYGASGGDKGVSYISPNDVADVAVHAIFDTKHTRQAYNLTGLAITDEEVATLLSDKLGTTIKYVDMPMGNVFNPEGFFDHDTAMLEKIKASGIEENFPKGDVNKVLPRDPETFADYLLQTDYMSPFELDALSIHTPTHCQKKEEEKVEEVAEAGVGLVQKMLHNIAMPAEVGEVAQ